MQSWRQAQGASHTPIPDAVWIFFWLHTISNVSVLPLNVNSDDKNTVSPQFILIHNTFMGLGVCISFCKWCNKGDEDGDDEDEDHSLSIAKHLPSIELFCETVVQVTARIRELQAWLPCRSFLQTPK